MTQENQLRYDHRLICLGCCNPQQGTIAANIWIFCITLLWIVLLIIEFVNDSISTDAFVIEIFLSIGSLFIGGCGVYGALKYKILPVQVSMIYILVETFYGVFLVFVSLNFLLLLYILLLFFLTYLPQHYFVELHKRSSSMEQQRQSHDDETVTSEADNNENVHEGQGQDQFEMAQRNRNLEVV